MAENFIVNPLPGSGYTSSVSNSDGSIIATPTTGDVVIGFNLAHANIWVAKQSIIVASPSAQFLVGYDASNTFDVKVDSVGNTVFNLVGDGPLFTFNQGVQFGSETADTIASFDSTKKITSLSTGTYPSLTELAYVKGVTSAIQTQLGNKQGLDATLTSLAAYNTNGLLTQTAADTFTGRTIVAGNGSLSVTNGNGVSGNPSIVIEPTNANTWTGQQTFNSAAALFGVGIRSPKIYPAADSTNAISFNKADSTTLVLGIDTTNGRVGFSSLPTSFLHLKAGVSGAGGSPLKFTLGTNQLTPEPGSAEYDGAAFYLSPSTTRKRIPLFTNITPTNGMTLIGNGTDFTAATLTGTSNQISVSNGSGSIQLSTPQNIHTAAEPTFAALLLSNSSSGTKIYNTQRTPGGTAGNTIEIGNLAVTTGAGYVEITLVGVTGGNVQGLKYQIPTAYNATADAWHTVMPVSNQSVYGETVALEMKQGTGSMFFRLRSISSGNPTLNVSVTTYGYASNAWTFTSATASGQAFVAYYKSAFMQQRNNVLDLRNGGYISSAGVDGTPPTTSSPGIQVTSTGSMIATENITNPVFTTRKAVFSVPTSGNADDIMTITTSEFSSYVEVTLNIHASGYAQSKKYLVPMSYNGTANAWQKVIPLYTTGAYGGNDCDLEINSNTTGTGTARFRLRRSGGSTAATAYIAFVGTGDVANTTYTLLTTSPYAASAPGVNYAPTSVSQLGGLSGVNTDAPTSSWYVNGSFGASYVAKTGTYTATVNDYTIDCTANTFTVNLPTAVGITGRIYVIKNSGAGVITIDGNASETIDGATTQTLAATTMYTIQSNGANWIIIGS